MLYNVGDLFVEIEGDLFPAGDIQIWPEHPELHWSAEHNVSYGAYFEMMFEDGCALLVSQEYAEEMSKGYISAGDCADLGHFHVIQTHMKSDYKDALFGWHCLSETHLGKVIKHVVENHKKEEGTTGNCGQFLNEYAKKWVA